MMTPYSSTKLKFRDDNKSWTQEDALGAFKKLFESPLCKYLRKMNKSQVPLSLVGHFLNQVGSHLLRHCAKIGDTKTEHKRLKVKNPIIF